MLRLGLIHSSYPHPLPVFSWLYTSPPQLNLSYFDYFRFSDIADVAFKKSASGRPRLMNSLSVSVADTVFSIVVELIFLVQGNLCTYIIPLASVGQVHLFVLSHEICCKQGPVLYKLGAYFYTTLRCNLSHFL